KEEKAAEEYEENLSANQEGRQGWKSRIPPRTQRKIVSHRLGVEKMGNVFKVRFTALGKSFWIRYEIVREYDSDGYRQYVRELIQKDKEIRAVEGTKRDGEGVEWKEEERE
ncbi:hypothetical protein PENTCL1PPCAC_19008, partial [Pristionchus entomophagus]